MNLEGIQALLSLVIIDYRYENDCNVDLEKVFETMSVELLEKIGLLILGETPPKIEELICKIRNEYYSFHTY